MRVVDGDGDGDSDDDDDDDDGANNDECDECDGNDDDDDDDGDNDGNDGDGDGGNILFEFLPRRILRDRAHFESCWLPLYWFHISSFTEQSFWVEPEASWTSSKSASDLDRDFENTWLDEDDDDDDDDEDDVFIAVRSAVADWDLIRRREVIFVEGSFRANFADGLVNKKKQKEPCSGEAVVMEKDREEAIPFSSSSSSSSS